ncbi:hypothetical protein ACFWFZ_30075 [Streptomyces sp. NPDC060232]|uniref:hypothetical protein n=1 Tax=Streptomyces sp. NPDC060232 TaxID=3347079 RepID=UPI0036592943
MEHVGEDVAVLQEDAGELIEGLEERIIRLGEALNTTLTLAGAHCLLDPQAAIFSTWDAWAEAVEVGSAVSTAVPTEEAVQRRIAHRDRSTPPARSGA